MTNRWPTYDLRKAHVHKWGGQWRACCPMPGGGHRISQHKTWVDAWTWLSHEMSTARG